MMIDPSVAEQNARAEMRNKVLAYTSYLVQPLHTPLQNKLLAGTSTTAMIAVATMAERYGLPSDTVLYRQSRSRH